MAGVRLDWVVGGSFGCQLPYGERRREVAEGNLQRMWKRLGTILANGRFMLPSENYQKLG